MSYGSSLAQLHRAEQRKDKKAIAFWKVECEKELKMRNISNHDNTFRVRIERSYKVIFCKDFETLEEAITYRDECLLFVENEFQKI